MPPHPRRAPPETSRRPATNEPPAESTGIQTFVRKLIYPPLLLMALLPMPVLPNCTVEPSGQGHGLDAAASQIQSVWQRNRPLLVGEVHGTNEVPRLVATLLERETCGHAVLLLLEMPETEQARIADFIASEGDMASRQHLLQGDFWTRNEQDGRSSNAVVDLVIQARKLRAAGRTLALAAFAPVGDGDGASYSSRMAANIRSAIERHPGHRVILLGGNYHSQVLETPGLEHDAQPVGWQLRDLDPLSIAVFARSGAYWSCDQARMCGRKDIAVSTRPAGAEPLKIAAPADGARWHGRLMLDGFTAAGPTTARLAPTQAGNPDQESQE